MKNIKPRNVVIVGAGRRANEFYVDVLKKLQADGLVKISQIVDLNIEIAKKLRKKLSNNNIEILCNTSDLSNLETSLVIIATPIDTHAEVIKSICKKSIPYRVLIEKPLSSDVKAAKEIIKLQKKIGLDIKIAYQFRFSLGFQNFYYLIKHLQKDNNPELSYMPPILFEFNKMRAISKRPSIGILKDCVMHFIDLINKTSEFDDVKILPTPVIFNSMYADEDIQKEAGLEIFIPSATDIHLYSKGLYFQILCNIFRGPRDRSINMTLYDSNVSRPGDSLKFNLEEETITIAESSESNKNLEHTLSYRTDGKFRKQLKSYKFIKKFIGSTSSIGERMMLDALFKTSDSMLCTPEEDVKNIILAEKVARKSLKLKVGFLENFKLKNR